MLDLLKSGKTTSEIQANLKEDGYPEVKMKSVRITLQRLGKLTKKNKRDSEKLNTFYSTQICLPKQKPLYSISLNFTNENDVITKQASKCSQCTILDDVNTSLAKEVENLNHEIKTYIQEINIVKPRLIRYNPQGVMISSLLKKQKELIQEINQKSKMSCREEIQKVKQRQISNASYWRKEKSFKI